jgi:hypothetical protein
MHDRKAYNSGPPKKSSAKKAAEIHQNDGDFKGEIKRGINDRWNRLVSINFPAAAEAGSERAGLALYQRAFRYKFCFRTPDKRELDRRPGTRNQDT